MGTTNSNLTREEICSHSGLLDGTIENHSCDPKMDCPECNGSGQCTECDGSGKVSCEECRGTGDCSDCHGQGSTTCHDCGGSGQCRRCHGSGSIICQQCGGSGFIYINDKRYKCKRCNGKGWQRCPDCTSTGSKIGRGLVAIATIGELDITGSGRGSGKCSTCGGSGRLKCDTCDGSGKCTNCHGSGLVTCEHCDGTGDCPNCDGTGKVTCTRCEGSGWYQTFSTYSTVCYALNYKYYSSDLLAEGLKLATGASVYSGIYKKWKSLDQTETDQTTELESRLNKSFGDGNQYRQLSENHAKVISEASIKDKPYSKSISATEILISKIDFRLNNQDYSVYLMGDNGTVMYGELPKKIEMYRPSFFQRIFLMFTKKSRHIAYIKLAAYIFACDGKDIIESTTLNTFLNLLKCNDKQKAALKAQLLSYNTGLPYNVFRKEIKSIFSSKKTLTFAWQCMAVDKQMSEQELELFDKLLSEYKNIKPEDVENIKRFASKYALLKDNTLVDEYLS